MLDSKAFFSVAKREKQVIRRNPAHIAQTGATALQSDFCRPQAKRTFNTCTNKFRPFWQLYILPKNGWRYE